MFRSLVDHQEVIPFVGGIADHLGADVFILQHDDRIFFVEHILVGHIECFRNAGMQPCHLFHQYPVCFPEGKIFRDIVEEAVDTAGKIAGGGKEFAFLECILVYQ